MVRDRLSDDAWEQIADVFPPPAAVGRKRKDPRDVVDGILYVLRTGCPWRDLHEEFGPWQSVYYHFNKWASDGTLDEALGRLTYAKPAEALSFSAGLAASIVTLEMYVRRRVGTLSNVRFVVTSSDRQTPILPVQFHIWGARGAYVERVVCQTKTIDLLAWGDGGSLPSNCDGSVRSCSAWQ